MGFWSTLGNIGRGLLPVAGGILGGPLGGMAGGALSNALGRGGGAKPQGRTTNSVQDRINTGYGDYQNRNRGLYDTISGMMPGQNERSQGLFDQLRKGYTDQYNKFSNPSDNAAYGTFDDFAHSGGIDPRLRAELEKTFGSADELAGWGKNFANTGGYTEADKANYRARGTSNVPSFFAALKDQMGQRAAAQGGYSPGYDAQMSKMSRDQAHESQAAVRDTEAGMNEQINANKLRGAGVWSDGIGQGMAGRSNLMGMIQHGREFGATGLAGLESEAKSGSMASLSGLADLFRSNPSVFSALIPLLQDNLNSGSSMLDREIAGSQGQQGMDLNRDQYNLDKWTRILGGLTGAAGSVGEYFGRNRARNGVDGTMIQMFNNHSTNPANYQPRA